MTTCFIYFYFQYRTKFLTKSLPIKPSVWTIKFKCKACEKFKPQYTSVYEDLDLSNNAVVGLYRRTLRKFFSMP